MGADPLSELLDAAREIRRVHEAQTAYGRQLQELAAEARRTGQNQTHRIPPRAYDYGNGVERLLLALERIDRKTRGQPRKGRRT